MGWLLAGRKIGLSLTHVLVHQHWHVLETATFDHLFYKKQYRYLSNGQASLS